MFPTTRNVIQLSRLIGPPLKRPWLLSLSETIDRLMDTPSGEYRAGSRFAPIQLKMRASILRLAFTADGVNWRDDRDHRRRGGKTSKRRDKREPIGTGVRLGTGWEVSRTLPECRCLLENYSRREFQRFAFLRKRFLCSLNLAWSFFLFFFFLFARVLFEDAIKCRVGYW